MTKRQVDDIIKCMYEPLFPDTPSECLCSKLLRSGLFSDWNVYWYKINTKKYAFICDYFKGRTTNEEKNTLRLMILHAFIEDTYK